MSSDTGSMYSPPESDVTRQVVGDGEFGSISAGLSGDFSFGIQEVMGEAWQLTKGSKGVIIGAMAILYGVAFLGGFAMALVAGAQEEATTSLLSQLTLTLITYPLIAGTLYYAIKRAAGDSSAGFADVFSCYSMTLPIFGFYILQTVLVILGMLLLILPGIYLGIAYVLGLPLLVDKRLGVWESLETSRKAITHVWFRFFGLLIVVGFAIGIGAVVTVGIGLIWLVPWGTLCVAVAYRRIFGYGPEPAAATS